MPNKQGKGNTTGEDGDESRVIRNTKRDLHAVREKVGKCRGFLGTLERMRQDEMMSARELQERGEVANHQGRDLHAALKRLNDRTRQLLADLEKAHASGMSLDEFIQATPQDELQSLSTPTAPRAGEEKGTHRRSHGGVSGGQGGQGGGSGAHGGGSTMGSHLRGRVDRLNLPHSNTDAAQTMMGVIGSPRLSLAHTAVDTDGYTPHYFLASPSPRIQSVNSFLQPSPLFTSQTPKGGTLKQPSSTPILSSTPSSSTHSYSNQPSSQQLL